VVLQVDGLSRAGEFQDVSLTVHSGEIVGLAGLVGSGRTEVLETIFGARTADEGSVVIDGQRLRRGDVGAAVRAGMGMAPEERKSQALLLGEPIWRNVTLATMSRYARAGFTDDPAAIRAAAAVTASLALYPADVRRRAATLSGGNQQKVVLARWLAAPDGQPLRLLLLDEPTRGVDVGARTDLYGVIRRLAAQGVAVLLVSSEVPEVLGLADRVLVMREGRVVHEAAADTLDEDRVLALVMSDVEEV
jgi:ribose transport system ATP-binding protein